MATTNEKSLKNSAAALGKKLGFLVTALFKKEKERRTMGALLNKMTPAQLVKFSEVLESKYIQSATAEMDSEYKNALKKIKTEHQNKRKNLEKETINKLKTIANLGAKK